MTTALLTLAQQAAHLGAHTISAAAYAIMPRYRLDPATQVNRYTIENCIVSSYGMPASHH